MNAVGRYHRVGLDRVSVRKYQLHAAVRALINVHDAVVEMNGLVRHGTGKRGMEVAAVAKQIWRAVSLFR